ncbi:MAG: hypothetical protein QXL01_04390 [Thermoplasmatales archaeon]
MSSAPNKFVLFREIFPFGKYPPEYVGEFESESQAFREMDRIRNSDPFASRYTKLYFKRYRKDYQVPRNPYEHEN